MIAFAVSWLVCATLAAMIMLYNMSKEYDRNKTKGR
jgi:hypothetical protein